MTANAPERGSPERGIRSRFRTEFGLVLEGLISGSPGARAAILSDADGDAIDFAHDPNDLSELDIQLVAAQTGQAVLRLALPGARARLGDATVMVETLDECMLATPVSTSYILAMMVRRHANLGRALARIEIARSALAAML